MKFWKATNPGRWIVVVDGQRLAERWHEHEAFQEALDKSGVGGKIDYRPHRTKIGEWTFKYTPKKGE